MEYFKPLLYLKKEFGDEDDPKDITYHLTLYFLVEPGYQYIGRTVTPNVDEDPKGIYAGKRKTVVKYIYQETDGNFKLQPVEASIPIHQKEIESTDTMGHTVEDHRIEVIVEAVHDDEMTVNQAHGGSSSVHYPDGDG